MLLDHGGKDQRKNEMRWRQRYEDELLRFESLGGRVTHRFPILTDYEDQAGTASGHYFHQDLLVARFIHQANPMRHIDIGSRIDGFVAHVAAFRRIEVLDVRDLKNTEHENIQFIKANLMDARSATECSTDSISCLHALEHFGLGRYGDPIDPTGHLKGFRNIVRMLKPGGMLYLSFPIGESNEVHFNAHRVFHPMEVLSWIEPEGLLNLVRFDYVDDVGALQKNANVKEVPALKYGCGIYSFRKV